MVQRISYAAHQGCKPSADNLPLHVAIIMDGNGRWAKARNLSRTAGHRKGVETARDIIFACQEHGIKVLTLFAFGRENWKRPTKEIRNLFRILYLVLRKEVARLHAHNIQLRIIGDQTVFNPALQQAIKAAEEETQANTGLILNIAVNYSGRWDLLRAMQKLIENPPLTPLTEEVISQQLALYPLPEPDLFIRTGGVQRLSNFVLWELAYTELYFTATMWPDFSKAELEQALLEFAHRERRFGLVTEQLG